MQQLVQLNYSSESCLNENYRMLFLRELRNDHLPITIPCIFYIFLFTAKPCDPLPALSNGRTIYQYGPDEVNYESAIFMCNDPTILSATSSTEAYCSKNGTWIYNFEQPPKCIEIPKELQEEIKTVEKYFMEQVSYYLKNKHFGLFAKKYCDTSN